MFLSVRQDVQPGFGWLRELGRQAVCSRFTGLNDDSGLLFLLGVVGFEEDFALLLRFINAHLFQSRFADSEICWMITLTSSAMFVILGF